jgi:hypothetical protein
MPITIFSKGRPMSTNTDRPHDPMPFYSRRTLEEVHRHVGDLRDGLAVYVSRDGAFATIGTRGIRPSDRTPGLIIHLSVILREEDPAHRSGSMIPPGFCHHLSHTPVTAGELRALLFTALEEAGLVPRGSRPGDDRWSYF